MINVNDFRNAVLAQANKNNAGFKPSAAEWNHFMVDGLREVYNWLFGSTTTYQPGRPVPIVSSEKTRYVSEAERYLQERRIMNTVANLVPIPNGVDVFDQEDNLCPAFRHLIKMINLYVGPSQSIEEYEVKVLPSRDVDHFLNSGINYPTIKRPIAELVGNAYRIYPQSGHITLVYQRQPLTPVWGYSVDTTIEARRRREIYDPATSVDIDLPDELQNLLKEKVLHMMGIRERDPFLVQASSGREKQGNV